MNKRRLLKLANLIESIADGTNKSVKFNLNTFGRVKSGKPFTHCGTQACILGVAAISGAFKRQGLSYAYRGTSRMWDEDYLMVRFKGPGGGVYHDFEAAARLFDISPYEAWCIFSDSTAYGMRSTPTGRRGARKAVKVIREFVEHGGIPKKVRR